MEFKSLVQITIFSPYKPHEVLVLEICPQSRNSLQRPNQKAKTKVLSILLRSLGSPQVLRFQVWAEEKNVTSLGFFKNHKRRN